MWIKVEDLVPQDGQLYIAFAPPNIMGVAFYRNSAWLVPDPEEDREFVGVSHWMKLPELPSKDLRELLCQKCGRDYPIWFAPNELWNKIVRDGEHFLCMDCFALTAESRGVDPTAWMLSEENLELSHVLEENRRLKLGLPLGHVTDGI